MTYYQEKKKKGKSTKNNLHCIYNILYRLKPPNDFFLFKQNTPSNRFEQDLTP